MGPKTHSKPYHTPSTGTLTCKLCGKQGLAYQCGFCDKFRTCGECGKCNDKSCACITKVVKPVDRAKGHPATSRAEGGVGMSSAMSVLAAMAEESQGPREVPKAKTGKAGAKEAGANQQAEKVEKKKKAAERETPKKENAKTASTEVKQKVDTPKSKSPANQKPETKGKPSATANPKATPANPKTAPKAQPSVTSNGKAVSADKASASTSPKPISKAQTTALITQALESVDVGAIGSASGDLAALIKLLGAHFKALAVPHIAIATSPTAKALGTPYDLASKKLRSALEKAVGASQPTQVTSTYCKLIDSLVHEQKKSGGAQGAGLALMLMAQAVAVVWPAEVAAAASHAAKIHGDYRNQSASITVMWMMGQTWNSSTPCAVEAWQQQLAPLFWAKSPDPAVYQYGQQYTSLLTKERLRGQSGGGIALDILNLCRKQYGEGRAAGSEGCRFLATKMDYFVRVWLEYATPQQMEVVFRKIINAFDMPSQPSPYYDTLAKVACGALVAHTAIFQKWGQAANQLANGDLKTYASYMAGSEHLVQKMCKNSLTSRLPPAMLKKAYVELAASGSTDWNKGKGEGKKGDISKIEEAITYFETQAAPRRRTSWLWSFLVVVGLLLCVTLKVNRHCLEYPCGPQRPCDFVTHPCLVVRSPAVAEVLDKATASLDYYKEAGTKAAQPLMPVINTGMQYTTKVAEKAQVYWTLHGAPLIETARLYASPALESLTSGAVLAQAKIMPYVNKAVVASRPYLDNAMAWLNSHVVATGMPYAKTAWDWFKANVMPRLEELSNQTLILTSKYTEVAMNDWLPKAMVLAGQVWERVQVYADMAATASAQWWQTTGQPAAMEMMKKGQQAATASAQWWQATGQPAVMEMMKKGQQAATASAQWWQATGQPAAMEMMKNGQQLLLIGTSKVQSGLAKIPPYVQSTVVPAAKDLWKESGNKLAQAKVWAQVQWATMQSARKEAKEAKAHQS